MTLIVEDGSGLSSANSYVPLADADAYFAARGVADWTAIGATASSREAALMQGCRYLENAYRGRWKGFRVHERQALAWPRCDSAPAGGGASAGPGALTDLDGFAIPTDAVPQRVKDVNCEAALLSLRAVDLSEAAMPPLRSRAAGDTREVFAAAHADRNPALIAIDRLLLGLLTSAPDASFGTVPVIRA